MTSPLGEASRQSIPSAATQPAGLADELDSLYDELRARLGPEDLEHIQRVAAWSEALEARGRELIATATTLEGLKRGILLRALHVVVEFSELGHNIMHGSYDAVPGAERFRSDRWVWDLVADPAQWRRMHHQNHHPNTNVVGEDHDLGYTVARLFADQDWFGHHLLQSLAPLLFLAPMPFFGIYTASSSARVQGLPPLCRETLRAPLGMLGRWARREYLSLPREAPARAPLVAAANHFSQAVGYSTVFFMLIVEHHAPNVAVFATRGPHEDRDAYYERQLRGTTNFDAAEPILDRIRAVLDEELPSVDAPPLTVLLGGLDTHLEHHLVPDLPCNRQREAVPRVKAICERHGMPYNVAPIGAALPQTLGKLLPMSAPVVDGERLIDLARHPRRTLRRVVDGLRYRSPDPERYLRAPRFYNATARVLDARPLGGGSAVWLRLARPRGWETLSWPPGAFLSLSVPVGGATHTRQYSLLRQSDESGPLEIAVRRVPGGRVSGFLCDAVRPGDDLTLVHPPTRHGGLVQPSPPARALCVAAGVGITPVLAMLRRHVDVQPLAPATLLYFNATRSRALFVTELGDLAARSALVIRHHVSDEGAPRLSAALLAELLPVMGETRVFACAPDALLSDLSEQLDALGHPGALRHVEHFRTDAAASLSRTGRTHRVRFARSGVLVEVDEGQTLLAAGREAGLELPSGCERGICRACACVLLEGQSGSASAARLPAGRVTLCNSYPRSDLVLDA